MRVCVYAVHVTSNLRLRVWVDARVREQSSMDAPDCLVGRYDGYTTAGSTVMHTFTVIISRGTVCTSCLVLSRFSRPRSFRRAVDTYLLVYVEVHDSFLIFLSKFFIFPE